MKTTMILGIALSMAAFGAFAADTANSASANSFQHISTATSATTDQAAQMASEILSKDAVRRDAIARATAPIRSRGDLEQYLATHRPGTAPLDALSPSLRQMFLSSLTFNEKGLTGFRYDVLASLTATDVYKIFSLFGMQGGTAQITNARVVTPTDALIMAPPMGGVIGIGIDFLKDYRCVGRASCHNDNTAACTSNC